MKRIVRWLFSLALFSVLAFPLVSQRNKDMVRVAIETEAGSMEVEIYAKKAPATAANFLRYVDGGYYEGGVFHRTVTMNNQPNDAVRIGVIQAGPNPAGQQLFPPIKLERTNRTGIKHVDGAISMARRGPDTAVADFFICVGDQPELDYGGKRNPDGQGFAAFGRVVKGMDVVKRIQESPAAGQRLTPPVRILRIRRLPTNLKP
jgi:peptidyl-prolyl cis-trans isomerase A (cyclophilin A)